MNVSIPVELDRDESLARIEIATLAVILVTTVIGNSTVLLALWIRKRDRGLSTLNRDILTGNSNQQQILLSQEPGTSTSAPDVIPEVQIRCGRKKLSSMYFFILHLSLADLIVALFSVLPQLIWEITYRFRGGFVLCKLVKYGQTLGPYLSSYVLMATALDRHQAICHPLTYYSWTSRRSKAMVYAAWVASLLCCIPQVFIFSYQEIAPGGSIDCWATFSRDWGEQAYVVWYSITIFLIPLLMLVYTYSRICREIWRCSDSSSALVRNGAPSIPLISRAKINTVKQTVAVIVLYTICSAPFIVAQFWATVDPGGSFLEGGTFTILTLLYSLNSCVNPWIYMAFNRELMRVLIRRFAHRRGASEVSNSSAEQMSTLKSTRHSPDDKRSWT